MKPPHTDAKSFILSGKLVGFVKAGRKLKGIKVKVDGIKYRIKLAKPLRKSLPPELEKGGSVQVSGAVKQKKSGGLKLKAEDLQMLNGASVAPFLDLIDVDNDSAGDGAKAQTALDPVVLGALEPDVPVVDSPNGVKPMKNAQTKILICQKGSCWKKRGGQAVHERLEKRLSDRGLSDAVTIKKTGCMDRCKSGPNLVVMPGKARYSRVGKADIETLIDQHVGPER